MEIEQTQLQITINQEINKNNVEKFQVKKEDSMTDSIDINDPFFELKYIFKEICKNQDQGTNEETKQSKKISYKEKQLINQKKILEIRQNLRNNQQMEQKLQQINSVQKKYAGLIYYAPQKFLNVETCYRLYDDFYFTEDTINSIKEQYQTQYEHYNKSLINCMEPMNSYKFIDYVEIDINKSYVSLYLKDRVNSNSPPLQYLIQRFRSFNNQQIFEFSQKLDYYLNKKQALIDQAKIFYNQCKNKGTIFGQKINSFLKQSVEENIDKLMLINHGTIDENGNLKILSYHISFRFIKILGYDVDSFQFDLMKNGFKQIFYQVDLNEKLEYFLNLFMFSHQQKTCPGFQGFQKMVQFVKSDGSLLVIDTFCEHLIHENNIVIRLNFHGNDLFLDHNPVQIITDHQKKLSKEEKIFLEVEQQSIQHQKFIEKQKNIYQCGYRSIK